MTSSMYDHVIRIQMLNCSFMFFQARSSVRLRLEKFRRKGVNLLQDSGKTDKNKKPEVPVSDIMKLTTSETRRNVGGSNEVSVLC